MKNYSIEEETSRAEVMSDASLPSTLTLVRDNAIESDIEINQRELQSRTSASARFDSQRGNV
jgi:hypothetical protein